MIYVLLMFWTYEVCSNSIWIGIVVVVHCVGCVCNQSWHVRTCLSNSWHKLQVAAFAQLNVVGRGSNTCIYVIAIFTMCESTKQRICIKFCFKIRKTTTETCQLLQQAYDEDAMGRTQVFDWFHRFKEGRTSIESDFCSGQPSTSRNKEMFVGTTIVHNNRRLTVREIADDCGTSVGSCDAILTDDLHMKRVCVKFMLRLLTNDQCEQVKRLPMSCLSVHVNMCSFVRTLWQLTSPGSTGATQRQNSSRHSGRVPHLCNQVRSKTKVMLLAFFDSEGIVHHKYAPHRQTINKEFYVEVLWRLHESVHRKWPEKCWDGDWILHHDNAPAHTSHLVQQFLAKHGTTQLQQPPYSPDLAPYDFFLFPRLKKVLKGHRFDAMEDVKWNSTKTLLGIPKEEFANVSNSGRNVGRSV